VSPRNPKEKSAEGEDLKELPEGEEKLTPEERLRRNITTGASNFCRFHTSLRPAKLMPGETGTMLVAAILQGQAVLPAPAPLELVQTVQSSPVAVGGLAVRPAELGRLAAGYVGRPVYENYAIFEVPVTLAAEAQVGKKYPVAVDLKFDLYDGASAQPIGRFLDRATLEIEVGRVPDPVVPTGAAAATASGPAPTTIEASKPEAVAPPAPVSGAIVVAPEPVAPAAAPNVASDAAASLSVEPEAGMPVVLIAGAGALLLGIVVLLARKR
jgi:hypothetical protein